MLQTFISNILFALIVPGIFLGMLGIIGSKFIPIKFLMYKVPMQLIGVVLIVFFVFQSGRYTEHNKYEAAKLVEQVKVAQRDTKSENVNVATVIRYVDRVRVVEKIKEVKTNVYVTKDADSACVIGPDVSSSVAKLLNESAKGIVSATTNQLDVETK